MTPVEKPPFRPLAVTLIRRTLQVATLCAVVVAAAQAWLAYRQAHQRFDDALHDIARTSVPLLSLSLWDIEPAIVRRQVQAIAERKEIGFVRLEARTGQMFEAGKESMRLPGGSEHFDIPYPNRSDGSIGGMEIWPDREARYAEIARAVLAVVLGYAMLTALVCVTMAVVLRRHLQRPMQQIAEFVNGMRPDSLTRPLKLQRAHARSRDEIDLVAEGFRTLQEGLNEHIANLDHLVSDRTKELKLAVDAIHELSITDPLTGCFNRRLFNDRFQNEIERAARYSRSLAIAFCDVDHFKQINDSYGHAIGDRVLARVGEQLMGQLRVDVDWVARYGGEEFVIVQPETSLAAAHAVAERLRRAIAEIGVEAGQSTIRVTASFGVAELTPKESAVSLLNRADALLYEAKEAGRNCVFPLQVEA